MPQVVVDKQKCMEGIEGKEISRRLVKQVSWPVKFAPACEIRSRNLCSGGKRTSSAETLAETCRAGSKEIFP